MNFHEQTEMRKGITVELILANKRGGHVGGGGGRGSGGETSQPQRRVAKRRLLS